MPASVLVVGAGIVGATTALAFAEQGYEVNVIDRATERSLLENLAQEDPELVEEIRRLMFVFEDIAIG